MSRSVVVLPAPFGPSSPKTDPAGTSRSSPSTRQHAAAARRTAWSARDRRPTAAGAAGSRHSLLAPDGEVEDRPEQADEHDDQPPHQLAVAADARSGRSRSRSAKTISPSSMTMIGRSSRTIWVLVDQRVHDARDVGAVDRRRLDRERLTALHRGALDPRRTRC